RAAAPVARGSGAAVLQRAGRCGNREDAGRQPGDGVVDRVASRRGRSPHAEGGIVITTEDRIRAAFRADAETVQPEHLRPLANHVRVVPARPREKPWLRLAVPFAAAAAVAAIAVTFAALAPGTPSGNAPAGPTAVVHSATGRLVARAGGLDQGYPGA